MTDERLQHVVQIFNEVNRTYFDGVIPAPTISLNPRLTHTAGRVWYDRWTMEISIPYFNPYGWGADLVDTVKHEAIHLYLAHTGRRSGHTKEFKAICQRIGTSLRCKAMPRRRPYYRYHTACSHCGRQFVSGSWKSTSACGVCCETYNGGQYTPEFQVTLVKRVRLPLPEPEDLMQLDVEQRQLTLFALPVA